MIYNRSFLDQPLVDSGLSPRALNACHKGGMRHVDDVKHFISNKGRKGLLNLPGCGVGTYNEICDLMGLPREEGNKVVKRKCPKCGTMV
jgi:hypothetical protein